MSGARQFVSTAVDGPIALITVDRPPVNAYNHQTHREIHDALTELGERDDLCCAVFTAAGATEGRPFGAGSDINEFVGLDPQTSLGRAKEVRRYFAALSNFPLPVVAAVENVCLGSGVAWAARADVRIISETAIFGMPELTVGALGGGKELTLLVGSGKAREMYYTGRRIDAAEALRLGAAQQLVPAGQARAAALELAHEMSQLSPFGLRLAKQQMNFAELELDRDAAYKYETELTALYRATSYASESAEAFLEKRRTRFSASDER